VSTPKVAPLGTGAFLVEIDGRREVVYVARTPAGRVAFCKGEVFREEPAVSGPAKAGHYGGPAKAGHYDGAAKAGPYSITAPMPATVLKVLVEPGASVKKGDTLVILEAMKMELPLRASGTGTVAAVHCRAGELVPPDAVLIELA
jgi:biotin carboxyl carrier protein